MTFSSKTENFKRASHQTLFLCVGGEFSRSRLKISSEIEIFKRKLEIFKRSSEIGFFQDSGPLGYRRFESPVFVSGHISPQTQTLVLGDLACSLCCVSNRALSGPLNRLNAILSLLHPLDRYRASSAIGSAIGRPLFRPISHPRSGRITQPPHPKPLMRLNRAIVVL